MVGQDQPSGPPLGPGMRAQTSQDREMFGRADTDEAYADLTIPLEQIPDDTEVDVTALLGEMKLEQTLERLDTDLVALHEVKARVAEIAALLVIDRLRRHLGIASVPPTLHMSFTGNPGTGKTTVAQQMGEVLYQLGYLRKGHVVSVTRDDLVGKYVGHTAPKTREVLNRATGGVLFIDEAYHIYRVDNERDYGQETVEMLLQVMENERQDLVVIMAGYKDKMDRFFSDVPGLSSRIGHHIDFPDYDLGDLLRIADVMNAQQGYRFEEAAVEAFRDYIALRKDQPRFANARSVRNALDRLRLRHADRLWQVLQTRSTLTKGELVTLCAEDIRASRVFDGGTVPPE